MRFPDKASSHCGSRDVVRRGETYEVGADAGRTARAAGGVACRRVLARFGDWDVPKGIAKNGDTIGES